MTLDNTSRHVEVKTNTLRILTTWPFLISLFILILNDWWFKASFPGFLTGKLSDFAGVAVVALLVFNAYPRRIRLNSLIICGAFLWWKSPLSDPLIHFINSLSDIQIGRTIDYSDLWALIVLPVSQYVVAEQSKFSIPLSQPKKIVTIPLATVSLLAIMGTSIVPTRQEYGVQPTSGSMEISRDNLVSAIADVAKEYGLTCGDCTMASDSGMYEGNGMSMSYTLTPDNAVTFIVEAYPNAMFFGASGEEKADELREALKSMLAERFEGLEYIEPLRANDY